MLRRQRDPQRCSRGARALAGSAPQHAPRAAFARGDLQSAQHAVLVRMDPAERGAALRCAKRLLVGPQRFGGRAAADDDEAGEIEPRCRQRRRIRAVRRRNPDDAAAFGLQPDERRQREPQFTDAFALEQQFGERAARPAAAGKCRVELGKSGCNAGRFRRAIAAAPDRGVRKQMRERGRMGSRRHWPRTGGRCAWMRAIVYRVTCAAHCESTACGKPKLRKSSARFVT